MKSAIRNYALLFAGCVLFHVAGTWSLPLIDRDEPRFAEAAREMRERGDYVVPFFNNQYRFDKPPLTYWAQIASYNVFGENDFAARFPSVIAAALTALAIFAWGSRIGGDRVGWWAAIIFTLSLQTFIHGKAAVADMWLVLFVTLAHWAGYELFGEKLGGQEQRPTSNVQRPTPNGPSRTGIQRSTLNHQTAWWLIFYVSLALGFLAKGPIGWFPLLTGAATIFFLRAPDMARRFKFARGLLLTIAIVSFWAIPALIQTEGEFFRIGIGRHVIERSFGAMEGHGAKSVGIYLLLLPFYFVTLFVTFFPWSVKLPRLTQRLWRHRDSLDLYLICGAAIIFVVFTLVVTKLPHYTLPAFPLLALVLARFLIVENSQRFVRNCALMAGTIWLMTAFIVPPLVAHLFPARELFRQSRDHLRPEMEFGAVNFTEPSLVWYFRSRAKGFLTNLKPKGAAEFMARPGPRFVVVPTSLATTLIADHPEAWKLFSTRGFNIVKGKRVDLTLILKPE